MCSCLNLQIHQLKQSLVHPEHSPGMLHMPQKSDQTQTQEAAESLWGRVEDDSRSLPRQTKPGSCSGFATHQEAGKHESGRNQ